MIANLILSAALIVAAALGWGFILSLSNSRGSRSLLLALTAATVIIWVFSSALFMEGLSQVISNLSVTWTALVFAADALLSLAFGYLFFSSSRTKKIFTHVNKLIDYDDQAADRSDIIEEILDRKEQSGEINVVERELLESVLKFNDKTVREVMIPRGDVVALNLDEPPRRVLRKVMEEGYSRLPVYRGSMDNIVGIIYAKDLLAMADDGAAIVLQDLLRTPFYVPETKKISDLLREMQRNKVHLAVVVDEFGGTEGIITLEDVLEEIVGEIQDEYDESQQELVRDENGAVHFSGSITVERFNELLDVHVPREDDYDTMAGFVQKLAGKLPQKGEIYGFEEMFFNVEELARHRIKRLKVSFKEHPSVIKEPLVVATEPPISLPAETGVKIDGDETVSPTKRASGRKVNHTGKRVGKTGARRVRKKKT